MHMHQVINQLVSREYEELPGHFVNRFQNKTAPMAVKKTM